MAKKQTRFLKNLRFSEPGLVVFAMVFATIGSYSWLKSFAAEEMPIVAQSQVSAEEKAVFTSLTGASAIILAAGPIAALLFWWIWRRSDMHIMAKLALTITPLLALMAFT